MNAADTRDRDIAPDMLVEIEALADDGRQRMVRGFKARPYEIPRGSIGAYYPECNPLLPLAHHGLKSKTPAAKSIPVLVRPQWAHPESAEQRSATRASGLQDVK
jgi:hypothetical protein